MSVGSCFTSADGGDQTVPQTPASTWLDHRRHCRFLSLIIIDPVLTPDEPGFAILTGEVIVAVMHAEHIPQHTFRVARHISAVPSILGHGLGMPDDRMASREAKVDVIVFAAAQVSVEATNLAQSVAPVHYSRVHGDDVTSQQVAKGVCPNGCDAVSAHRLKLCVDTPMSSIDQGRARICRKGGEPGGNRVRSEAVVGVKED